MDVLELNKQADILRNSGKVKEAIPLYQKLAEDYDRQGDVFHSGGALQMVGVCYKLTKDEENALSWLRKALDYYTEHNHQTGQGNVWRDIGVIYEYVGKYDQAKEALKKSEELLKNSEDQGAYGITLAKLGLVAMRKKDYQKAEDLLNQALKITREANHWFMTLTTLLHLTELSILTDRLDDADAFAKEVVNLLDHPEEEGHGNRRAEILTLQGVISKRRSDKTGSDKFLKQARELLEQADPEVQNQLSDKWYFKQLAAK